MQTGVFGARMEVALVNEGPVTIVLMHNRIPVASPTYPLTQSSDVGAGGSEAGPAHRDVRDWQVERHRELAERGYNAVDTERVLRCPTGRPPAVGEDSIPQLLATEDADVLFVAGCEENQGTFHPQFDHIVLLSAPLETMVERLQTRTKNPYGKSPLELGRFLEDVETVEPLLRRAADHEVRTTAPLDEVVATILRLVDVE